MPVIEDERTAASIHAGISSQLFAASLVLIAVLLGFFDIKEIGFGSVKGVLILISILMLLLSLICAGKGLQKIRDNGTDGNWALDNVHIYFRVQTILNIIPIILFFLIFLLPDKETKQELFQREMTQIEAAHLKIDSLMYEQKKREIELQNAYLMKMDSLNRSINQLRQNNNKE